MKWYKYFVRCKGVHYEHQSIYKKNYPFEEYIKKYFCFNTLIFTIHKIKNWKTYFYAFLLILKLFIFGYWLNVTNYLIKDNYFILLNYVLGFLWYRNINCIVFLRSFVIYYLHYFTEIWRLKCFEFNIQFEEVDAM